MEFLEQFLTKLREDYRVELLENFSAEIFKEFPIKSLEEFPNELLEKKIVRNFWKKSFFLECETFRGIFNKKLKEARRATPKVYYS